MESLHDLQLWPLFRFISANSVSRWQPGLHARLLRHRAERAPWLAWYHNFQALSRGSRWRRIQNSSHGPPNLQRHPTPSRLALQIRPSRLHLKAPNRLSTPRLHLQLPNLIPHKNLPPNEVIPIRNFIKYSPNRFLKISKLPRATNRAFSGDVIRYARWWHLIKYSACDRFVAYWGRNRSNQRPSWGRGGLVFKAVQNGADEVRGIKWVLGELGGEFHYFERDS